jgi:transcriptional regulator with XRE-family HTH domain
MNAIRTARDQAGLTQAQAAALLGVTRLTWLRWETGAANPPSEAQWRYFLHVTGLERIPFKQKISSDNA